MRMGVQDSNISSLFLALTPFASPDFPTAATSSPVYQHCDEAYISPETSRLIDEVMDKYRTCRLDVKPIASAEIDLKQSA